MSSALRDLLIAVAQRAGEVREENPQETWEVQHTTYLSTIYVPGGMDAPSYFATGSNGLKACDLVGYTRTFPNGEWLMAAMGFSG